MSIEDILERIMNPNFDRHCSECGILLNDAGKCPQCDDLDSRYNED